MNGDTEAIKNTFYIKNTNYLIVYLVLLSPIMLWSILLPKNIGLWLIESVPVQLSIIILIKTNREFPLSVFSYFLLYISSLLVLVGAHYSYSHVPFFNWIKDQMNWSRNNYDKVGHFFQGFTTIIVVREYFLRKKLISAKKWIDILAFTFAMAIAAIWEIIEWLAVVVLVMFGISKPASQFMGAQGYFWDTQTDMFSALIGAIIAVLVFGKYHEKQLRI